MPNFGEPKRTLPMFRFLISSIPMPARTFTENHAAHNGNSAWDQTSDPSREIADSGAENRAGWIGLGPFGQRAP
jgi:hypothetical protein